MILMSRGLIRRKSESGAKAGDKPTNWEMGHEHSNQCLTAKLNKCLLPFLKTAFITKHLYFSVVPTFWFRFFGASYMDLITLPRDAPHSLRHGNHGLPGGMLVLAEAFEPSHLSLQVMVDKSCSFKGPQTQLPVSLCSKLGTQALEL